MNDALAAIEEFEDWWLAVTEYANLDGDYSLPSDFYQRNARVCKQAKNAGHDVTAFHEIGALVKRHAGIVSSHPEFPRSPDPHASISALHDAIWRGLPTKDAFLLHLCDALDPAKKRKRVKPKGKTVDIIRAIQAGKSTDAVCETTGCSADVARKVKSKLGRDEYEI